MNLKEYSKILNDTLERVENETGQQFSKDVEILAIYKYLNTPVIKSAYPNIALIHDIKNDAYMLEYNADGFHKFFAFKTEDGFEFRSKFGNYSNILNGLKPMISEAIQSSAKNMKELLKPASTFKDFIKNISDNDLNNIIAVSDRNYAEFFKVVKMIKQEAPLTRDFLKLALKVMNKSNQDAKFIDNYTEDRVYDMIKEGVAEGSDGLGQLKRLLHIQDFDIDNYDFDDIDEDIQVKFLKNIINESFPKNSIGYLLLNDHKNFIHNVFEQLVFENLKKPLCFSMKLINNDLTVEQLYKDNPIVDIVFNEALKKDPLLNEQPENLFKHNIIKDNDIFTYEQGVDYFAYIDHIVEETDRSSVMMEHFKTPPHRRSYAVIDPELDVDVVRFIGTAGPDVRYLLCASVDKKSESKYKTLNLDTYLLTKNVSPQQLEDAVKNVIYYCKKNELILCLDHKSMQQGLNYDEDDIVCNTVDKFKTEICAVLLPSSSEKKRHTLISNLDLPYADIVKLDHKIGEMIEANMNVDDMATMLKVGNKPIKLKM